MPWQDIIGMRHRLVHGYDEIDLDVVWEVIQQDLPPLIEELKRILPSSNP
ncbi:MAG: HepT-like ribonuclease domain-containing protein [bacterium]